MSLATLLSTVSILYSKVCLCIFLMSIAGIPSFDVEYKLIVDLCKFSQLWN